ncbi:MAG TPA: gephyrin-like molybdotransferase Glp [Methylomirabilota bacterium]|jgi:molybdopterin molybdotransferase|nr:gephyrin-like molybdotransferase Glp [Methylomirabilota bacterium]
MISVEQALNRILAGLGGPMPAEEVPLTHALGRILASDVTAALTQPPMAVSAMDGYAVRSADVASVPAKLTVIGVAPAGRPFDGAVGPGQAVRIFTGAAVPEGADAILIQEDAEASGDTVILREAATPGRFVRPAGLDFQAGSVGLRAGKRLTARDIGLAAAMNRPWLKLRRRPRVAILSTGDELVNPGEAPGPGQIVSSNAFALAAFVEAEGGEALMLGIARDDPADLARAIAAAEGADLLLTSGGASVGDHDLIAGALEEAGMMLDFWKIAMRPGKPLLFGTLGRMPVLGLPGNPVSSLVCAIVFLRPALAALLGRASANAGPTQARLGRDLPENDRRQDYLRSELAGDAAGGLIATPFERQDSAMLSLLARAGCLVIRPPHAPPAHSGQPVPILRLDGLI